MNAYFCRVSAEKNQGRPTCQVYIETKGHEQLFWNLEGTRRLWTKREVNRPESRAAVQGVGAGAPPAEPIRGELVDPASTAFEVEY
jgi:hypothetical protein